MTSRSSKHSPGAAAGVVYKYNFCIGCRSVSNTADTERRLLLHVKQNGVKTWFSKYSKDRKIQDSGVLIKPPYKVTTED